MKFYLYYDGLDLFTDVTELVMNRYYSSHSVSLRPVYIAIKNEYRANQVFVTSDKSKLPHEIQALRALLKVKNI
ncbi:hypothetical protein HNQ94_000384 [Salirhabdus euzebyi]|uniref:Uncharacterized protein n=1 Tax=Salirhabdus euzebyi TaxID=394506 RepID=A0A841Q1D2_9BACI|nr:hypothetical protein [Salirhabdus euzebyi]MBB6451963.1 hypothetical protein [Salirhabdus euzebyi]